LIESNRFEIIMPPSLALICLVKRFMPNLFRALAQRRFRRYVIGPDKVGPGSKTSGTNKDKERLIG
jgi:hypothetical protein